MLWSVGFSPFGMYQHLSFFLFIVSAIRKYILWADGVGEMVAGWGYAQRRVLAISTQVDWPGSDI
jgi:hypothetical protein